MNKSKAEILLHVLDDANWAHMWSMARHVGWEKSNEAIEVKNLRGLVKDGLVSEIVARGYADEMQPYTFGYYKDGTVTSEYEYSFDINWVNKVSLYPTQYDESEDGFSDQIDYILDQWGL